MTKKEILEAIKLIEKKNKVKYDLRSDEDTNQLFFELSQKIDIPFEIYARSTEDDYWLQCEYYSRKLQKTIIWSHDVGNFDDTKEVADYIIHITREVKEFESKLSFKKN